LSSKYDALGGFLASRDTSEVPLSFSDIEEIIGGRLPEKAVNIRAWWSNNPSNNTMTKVWLEAGFRTERVDIPGRRLVFRRVARRTASKAPAEQVTTPKLSGSLLDRIRKRMGGTVRVPHGVDLTAPSGETWDAAEQ
jgi:hypothetical protein